MVLLNKDKKHKLSYFPIIKWGLTKKKKQVSRNIDYICFINQVSNNKQLKENDGFS